MAFRIGWTHVKNCCLWTGQQNFSHTLRAQFYGPPIGRFGCASRLAHHRQPGPRPQHLEVSPVGTVDSQAAGLAVSDGLLQQAGESGLIVGGTGGENQNGKMT